MIVRRDRSEQVDYVSSQLLSRASLLTRLLAREIGNDISRTELGVLNVLSIGPRRITELAELEGLAQPTMTVLIKRLEDRQLVKRARPTDDGRVVLVSLAPQGRRVLEDARSRVSAAMHEYLAEVSDAHVTALADATETLAQLITTLQAQSPRDRRPVGPEEVGQDRSALKGVGSNGLRDQQKANNSRPGSRNARGQQVMTKERAAKVLRNAGIPADEIKELLAEFPDPFSLDRAAPIFVRHGLTIGALTDRMGGSP